MSIIISYDDIVVGAPIYSGFFDVEIGRIFIFENDQVSLIIKYSKLL